MNPWKFLLSSVLSATFAVQPALAGQGGRVIDVVTFKLKTGVAAGRSCQREVAIAWCLRASAVSTERRPFADDSTQGSA